MRIFFIILALVIMTGLIADKVTIYNSNFAMVNQNIDLSLKKGDHNYYFDDITSMLESNSVILEAPNSNFTLLSQNFEFDLASSSRVFDKYLGKEVTVVTTDQSTFTGIMKFNDRNTIGLVDTDGALRLIRNDEIQHSKLSQMPDNFFLKPTLNWRIQSPKSKKSHLKLSYLTKGLTWEATYNGVWDSNSETLYLSSWITLVNTSGKSFKNIDLKLMAGEVNRSKKNRNNRAKYSNTAMYAVDGLTASPIEKEFHDYHLYTFQFPVTLNNKQTKQLKLFPDKNVKAKSFYRYRTNSKKVHSMIRFTNDKKSGLGLALPGGIFKIYKTDSDDNSNQFIGEDQIEHTPKKEEVYLKSGNAFDIVGETIVVDHRHISQNKQQKDMKVSIRNRSKKSIEVDVLHDMNTRWEISAPSVIPEREDANSYIFKIKLKPNQKKEITWTEMIGY